jgi:hypothetical protein
VSLWSALARSEWWVPERPRERCSTAPEPVPPEPPALPAQALPGRALRRPARVRQVPEQVPPELKLERVLPGRVLPE